MMPSLTAQEWAEKKVRHFSTMLLAVGFLFVVTEMVAYSGWIASLRPATFQEVTANVLFAIGFGCPLVLYLSSRPAWREIAVVVVIGATLAGVLWQIQILLGLPEEFAANEVAAAQGITGLGLASLGVLAWRAWQSAGWERTRALIFLLPSCVALLYTLEAGIFLYFIKAICTQTYDANAYIADEAFGVQLSFVLGRAFAASPALKYVCFAIYVAPPPALIFVYALQTRARRPPPMDVVTALLALALIGYGLYFLCPVCGPLFTFGDAFPDTHPYWRRFVGMRFDAPSRPDAWPNGMPSLHLGSVILAYWHAKPYGWWARGSAAVFVVGTFLATLGLGEHYFIDLVVALPFTLAVHAGCHLFCRGVRRVALFAFLGAAVLVGFWYLYLFEGLDLLLTSPWVAWGLTLSTLCAVVGLEGHLYRAIQPMQARKIAPGPGGHWLLGHLLEFRRDVLGLLLQGRKECGDVVRFRLGPLIVHLLSHPEHVKHVLVTHHQRYNKKTHSSAKIRLLTGEGLLTSSGDFWLQQRRLVQPAFHAQRIAAFTEVMTGATAVMIERWKLLAKQEQPLDVASEMMRLTCTIVATALFGADVTADMEELEEAATTAMEHLWSRLENLTSFPTLLPTPSNQRFRKALGKIDALVARIIESRKSDPTVRNDLLSLLLRERDSETGRGMSTASVRNETVTLLLAGHETTANALTWTWYLLSQHPEYAERVRAEVEEVLGSQTPTFHDLPRLKYTLLVIQEAMRLYPPIWIMERRVLEDDVIGGFDIPAGSTVVLAPWVTHRHPDFWENPDDFDPERFLPNRSANRPPHAYFPFGAGQRLCVGNLFALTEAQIIVAMVTQVFRLELQSGFVAKPKPGITLRCEGGLPMMPRLVD